MGLRSFDVFAKPVEGLKNKSAAGGLITVLATSTAAILFISQLIVYFQLETRQHFQLAKSYTTNDLPVSPVYRSTKRNNRPAKIVQQQRSRELKNVKLSIHVTFPYIACSDLEFSLDGAKGKDLDSTHGLSAITKRPPSMAEIYAIQKSLQDEESLEISRQKSKACTFQGHLYVPRVVGSFGISIASKSWHHQAQTLMELLFNSGDGMGGVNDRRNQVHNATHFIHNIEFGTSFPRAENPLQQQITVFNFPVTEQGSSPDSNVKVNHHSGIGLSSVVIKCVNTKYKRFGRSTKDTYQLSVTQHTVTPSTLARQYRSMLPGLSVVYDFTPFSVHHSETRENIFLFLGNLVSIVGGVFVTIGLVSSCLMSAVGVGKKID